MSWMPWRIWNVRLVRPLGSWLPRVGLMLPRSQCCAIRRLKGLLVRMAGTVAVVVSWTSWTSSQVLAR